MKNKIILLGLAGSLILGNASIAKDNQYIEATNKNRLIKQPPINAEVGMKKVKITSETIKSNTEDIDVDIKIPVVKGLKDEIYQEQLNYKIKSTAKKDLNEFKKIAEELKELNIEWTPEIRINYEIKSDEDILSFVVTTYSYVGGANGMSRKDYYNIDIKGNKIVKLEDLFKENSNYRTVLNDEINRQIKKQMAANEKMYFEGEEGFKSIKDEQSFYIDESKNLVITFQMYDIAPRSSGYPEFEIPKENIVHILKEVESITADSEITSFDRIIINGKKRKLENPMFQSEKGRVMMPLSEVAKALDFEVTWDGKNKVASMKKGPVSAGAYVNHDRYYFLKSFVYLEEKAQLIKGRTYVPISFIQQVLQGQITVNEDGMLNIIY